MRLRHPQSLADLLHRFDAGPRNRDNAQNDRRRAEALQKAQIVVTVRVLDRDGMNR